MGRVLHIQGNENKSLESVTSGYIKAEYCLTRFVAEVETHV